MQISLQIGSFGLEQNFNVYVFRKRQLRFLRNVTRCYAKNIIVQTFSVLLSHYHRITIALPSYTNARVIQEICFVGVNAQNSVLQGL